MAAVNETKYIVLHEGAFTLSELKPLTQAAVCLVFNPDVHGGFSVNDLMGRTQVLFIDLLAKSELDSKVSGRSWFATNRGLIADHQEWRTFFRLKEGVPSSLDLIHSIKEKYGVRYVIKHLPSWQGVQRAAEFFQRLQTDHLPSGDATRRGLCGKIMAVVFKLLSR